MQKEWREITDKRYEPKGGSDHCVLVLSQVQRQIFLLWCSPWRPAITCPFIRAHGHTHAITDVTRIQEGVAAYYILTAHGGRRAWLGLFKRLRLDKQRGFCLCSLLISFPLPLCHISVLLCTFTQARIHTPHLHINMHQRPKLNLDYNHGRIASVTPSYE